MADLLAWATLTTEQLRKLNNELDEDSRQEAKRERRADRIEARQLDAEEFDFERDCGARP